MGNYKWERGWLTDFDKMADLAGNFLWHWGMQREVEGNINKVSAAGLCAGWKIATRSAWFLALRLNNKISISEGVGVGRGKKNQAPWKGIPGA